MPTPEVKNSEVENSLNEQLGVSFDLADKSNEILKLLTSKANGQAKGQLDKVLEYLSSQQGGGLIFGTLLKLVESILNVTKETVGSYKTFTHRFLDFFNFFNGELNLKLGMNMNNDQLRIGNLTDPNSYKIKFKRSFKGKMIDQKKIKDIILNKLSKTVSGNEALYNSSTDTFMKKYLELVADYTEKFKQISDELKNSI